MTWAPGTGGLKRPTRPDMPREQKIALSTASSVASITAS